MILTFVVPQLVNLVDGSSSEVNPLTSDKHCGADPEWNVGVELSDDRATPGIRGSHRVFQPRVWMVKLKNAFEVGKPRSGTKECLQLW